MTHRSRKWWWWRGGEGIQENEENLSSLGLIASSYLVNRCLTSSHVRVFLCCSNTGTFPKECLWKLQRREHMYKTSTVRTRLQTKSHDVFEQ